MPSRETPSYSSSRVQRASRLNSLEQVRLQQRLMLLEKARLHQARLTNQDIRLTSLALEYILNCSGHSPEGRGPAGQQGGEDPGQTEDPCFLYGERVVSRKVRRMPRPQSAVERATFRRGGAPAPDGESLASGEEDSGSVHSRLPPRPQSSPAKGRTWAWAQPDPRARAGEGEAEFERGSTRAKTPTTTSRPSTAESAGGRGGGGRETPGGWGRVTPHQAWEDDTDDITKRLLKAQQLHHHQQQQLQQQNARRPNRYPKDLGRRPPTPKTARPSPSPTPRPTTPSASTPTPTTPIVDRKPVSPRQKRATSGGPGRRAGLTEIMSQARATMSAGAWRSHLASTPTVPRSAESQRQVMMEARRTAERQRQQQVMKKVETFIGQLAANT